MAKLARNYKIFFEHINLPKSCFLVAAHDTIDALEKVNWLIERLGYVVAGSRRRNTKSRTFILYPKHLYHLCSGYMRKYQIRVRVVNLKEKK